MNKPRQRDLVGGLCLTLGVVAVLAFIASIVVAFWLAGVA